MSPSVMLTMIPGHKPHPVSTTVSNPIGIIRVTKGMARRLVIRKYFGNVPKYAKAIGAVVIWHAIEREEQSHIHFNPFIVNPLSALSAGHKSRSFGKMYAMPAIAAYDSWNPTSLISAGVRIS